MPNKTVLRVIHQEQDTVHLNLRTTLPKTVLRVIHRGQEPVHRHGAGGGHESDGLPAVAGGKRAQHAGGRDLAGWLTNWLADWLIGFICQSVWWVGLSASWFVVWWVGWPLCCFGVGVHGDLDVTGWRFF